MLKTSKYINRVKIHDDLHFVYHSLFNNPLLIDNAINELLDFLMVPKDSSTVSSLFGDETPDVLESLKDKSLIITPHFDERAKLRDLQKGFLENLSKGSMLCRLELAISDACNLGCRHCMHFNNNKIDDRRSKSLFMSFQIARKCIDEFCENAIENNIRSIRVHFGNAEPFLNWDVMRKCLEYCGSLSELKFSFAVNTNLTILTEEIISYLRKYKVKISTSLDGLQKGNDKIRIYPNGQGTFGDITHNLERLRSANYPVDGFGITLTSENFPLINFGIIDFAKKFNISDISLDVDLANDDCLDIGQAIDKIMELRNYARSQGIKFYGTWETPYRILLTGSWITGIHSFCPAMEGKTLHYGIDGSLKVCGHTNTIVCQNESLRDSVGIGSSYYGMVESRLPGNNKMCIDCEIEGACAGQCHVTRESAERSVNIVAKLCTLLRETTKRLIISDYRITSL